MTGHSVARAISASGRTTSSAGGSAKRDVTGTPSMEEISSVFHLPIDKAAKKLGVGQTWLKHTCREHGVKRWPFRKIASLQSSAERLAESIADIDPETTDCPEELERYRTVVEQINQLHNARVAICRGQCPSECARHAEGALKAAARRGRMLNQSLAKCKQGATSKSEETSSGQLLPEMSDQTEPSAALHERDCAPLAEDMERLIRQATAGVGPSLGSSSHLRRPSARSVYTGEPSLTHINTFRSDFETEAYSSTAESPNGRSNFVAAGKAFSRGGFSPPGADHPSLGVAAHAFGAQAQESTGSLGSAFNAYDLLDESDLLLSGFPSVGDLGDPCGMSGFGSGPLQAGQHVFQFSHEPAPPAPPEDDFLTCLEGLNSFDEPLLMPQSLQAGVPLGPGSTSIQPSRPGPGADRGMRCQQMDGFMQPKHAQLPPAAQTLQAGRWTINCGAPLQMG